MNEVQVVSSWLSPTTLFCILNLTIATIFILNTRKHNNDQQKHEHNPQLTRVPSLFERVKSFNLLTYQPDPVHRTITPEPQLDPEEISHVSEAETRATTREKTTALSRGEDEGVDLKADDFINRFRQQLKLQRLNSILRYKEMLNRGMGRS